MWGGSTFDHTLITSSLLRRFSAQLASALAYLHAQSPAIVFRDLSAANVVLTSTVTRGADIKLIDFGLHKLMPAAKLLTLTEGESSWPFMNTPAAPLQRA